MSQAPRLDVGVVGAGAVGIALGLALAGAGHRIVAVSTSSERHRDRLETAMPQVPVVDEAQVIERADLVVLALPGDQLAVFVEGTAAAQLWRPGQLALHTAPQFGERVLDPIARQGVIPLAVSPAVQLTDTGLDVQRMHGAAFAVSAPPAVAPIAQALVIEMGGEPVPISDADRSVYAEARAVAGDFSRAIVDQSTGLLREIGVQNPARLIRSVIQSSVDAALDRSQWPDSDPGLTDLRPDER
ncbi:DUF2520 domain-containing protein [Pseudoclavibacter sp. CFCC 11306]|uniref:DUF2520 domain-containing protein n=1 Tax=Pseudoclavibacter sp. CFCC 11306 TaxID=1564493 RepID=UPI0017878650|nr:DUF2520 domain-containing protein [Pseudoclavibacter sp. CFCC 11306]